MGINSAVLAPNPLIPPLVEPEIETPFPLPVVLQRTTKAVGRFLRTPLELPTDDAPHGKKKAFDELMEICRKNCHGLFLPAQPGKWGIEGKIEATRDFIELWLAKKLAPLVDLTDEEITVWEQSGIGNYWSNECRSALKKEVVRICEKERIRKSKKKPKIHEVSLDEEARPGLPYGTLLANDGGFCCALNPKPQGNLEPDKLARYIEDYSHTFAALGEMGKVLIAVLRVFPAERYGAMTVAVAEALGIKERQARRYLEKLEPLMKEEIRKGNVVIQGLFSLLQNGDDLLPQMRRQWNDRSRPCYMAFSLNTPAKPGSDGGEEDDDQD